MLNQAVHIFTTALFKVKYYAMKTYGGVEVYLNAFLNCALDGCEWSASRPARFNSLWNGF
jgi:hypothetical protein